MKIKLTEQQFRRVILKEQKTKAPEYWDWAQSQGDNEAFYGGTGENWPEDEVRHEERMSREYFGCYPEKLFDKFKVEDLPPSVDHELIWATHPESGIITQADIDKMEQLKQENDVVEIEKLIEVVRKRLDVYLKKHHISTNCPRHK